MSDDETNETSEPTDTDCRAMRRVLTPTEWADFREWLRSVA